MNESEEGLLGLAWRQCRMALLGMVLLLCAGALLCAWMDWLRLLALWCYVPSILAVLLAGVILLPGDLERGWARLAYPALCLAGLAPFLTFDLRNAHHTLYLSVGALLAGLAALWLMQELNRLIAHARGGACFPGDPQFVGRALSVATLYGVAVPLVAVYASVFGSSYMGWDDMTVANCWENPPMVMFWTGRVVYWISLAVVLLQAVLVLCMAADLGENEAKKQGGNECQLN
ncbi:MAG: hypothetical protein IJJ33_14900 [Victivallales bacterium]|nr:hypothetical protein [Victivallales bacterium]